MRPRDPVLLACLGALLASSPAHSQTCPTNTLGIGGENDEQVTGHTASRTVYAQSSFGTARYAARGDTASLSLQYSGNGGGLVDVFDRITLLGAPPGNTVPVTIVLHPKGSTYAYPWLSPYNEVFLTWSLESAFTVTRTYRMTCDVPNEVCGSNFDETITQITPFWPGEPRLFETRLRTYASGPYSGQHTVIATRSFQDLPPGAFMVSCSADTLTPVLDAGPEPATGLALEAIWPNPARHSIHVSCSLPFGASAYLRLHDVNGRVVTTRTVEPAPSRRMLTLDGPFAPGTYFLQLRQGAVSSTRAVTIVR